MLFLTEGFTISGLRRHLGFSYVGAWQNICIHGLKLWTKHAYNTKTYVFSMDVAHFWGTFSDHTFPSIFVIYSSAILHFRWRVTSRNHVNSIFRPGAHENMKVIIEKCLLLLIGRFRIEHRTFRRFPKMYSTSGFHATMLTFPVEMWQTLGQYGDKQPLESLTMWRL